MAELTTAQQTICDFMDHFQVALPPDHPTDRLNILTQFIEWPQVPQDFQTHMVSWCGQHAEHFRSLAQRPEHADSVEIAEHIAIAFDGMQKMFLRREKLNIDSKELWAAYEHLRELIVTGQIDPRDTDGEWPEFIS